MHESREVIWQEHRSATASIMVCYIWQNTWTGFIVTTDESCALLNSARTTVLIFADSQIAHCDCIFECKYFGGESLSLLLYPSGNHNYKVMLLPRFHRYSGSLCSCVDCSATGAPMNISKNSRLTISYAILEPAWEAPDDGCSGIACW